MWNIKQEFETNGFVVIEDLFTDAEINEMKLECSKLIEIIPEQSKKTIFSTTDSDVQQSKDRYFLDSSDKISYFYESDAFATDGELKVDIKLSLNKIGHALHTLNPVFNKYTLDERIKECCFQLGLQDPAIVQSMYIFKNPEIGSEVTPHQDASYLFTEPVNLVGFWIPLEDATLENGCLWFSKGSHKSDTHRRYIRNPDKTSDELLIYNLPAPIYQKSSFTAAPVKKGSCVLIHGQVVHYSEANHSSKSRNAYTFHIVERKNTKWSEENWIQPPGNGFLGLYKN